MQKGHFGREDDPLHFLREHFPGLDCLEHGSEVVPSGLRQLDVIVQRTAVESFRFGDLLGVPGEDFGQTAAG